jgi:hypothetical protein
MPDLPLLSQTDVTIQNRTTSAVDFLKYEGSTLVGSQMFNYGLGSDFKIVAQDIGSNTLPGLVAQSQSTGFVDFLTLDANANLVASAMSSVAVPRIFGVVPDNNSWFGTQLGDGTLDFVLFNKTSGALTGSDLVTNSTGLPQANSIYSWKQQPGPPAWAGLGGGLNGDIVQTQAADGSLDMIGFSGGLSTGNLAVNSSFSVAGSAGTSPIGEANPDLFTAENLQDASAAPQGLQDVAMTASGQLDVLYYDTGLADLANQGTLYASNLLQGNFSGWNVVQGGFVNHTDLFPIS